MSDVKSFRRLLEERIARAIYEHEDIKSHCAAADAAVWLGVLEGLCRAARLWDEWGYIDVKFNLEWAQKNYPIDTIDMNGSS